MAVVASIAPTTGGSHALDVALDVLLASGAEAVELVGGPPPRALGLFHVTDAESLRDTLSVALERVGLSGEVTFGPAAMVDWDSVWRPALRPFRIGPLTVVPEGGEPPEPGALLIEVGPAFGSGLHATTRLCLQHLVEHPPKGALLDLGTGTGVLALAALRLGATRALGVDTDPRALAVASRNAARNGLADRFSVSEARPDRLEERFPRVVANLLGAPLAEMAPVLAKTLASGGELALSGFPVGQGDEVAAAYVRLGLRLVTRAELDGWARIDLVASW